MTYVFLCAVPFRAVHTSNLINSVFCIKPPSVRIHRAKVGTSVGKSSKRGRGCLNIKAIGFDLGHEPIKGIFGSENNTVVQTQTQPISQEQLSEVEVFLRSLDHQLRWSLCRCREEC
jgi:hypothetical protein